MGTLNEDLTGIKAIEDKLTANKVANFAYTDHAYANPLTEADGVEYYNVDAEQNIPLPDPSVMNVNETVLTKGFRSQASSIPRMLLNHFLGRVSYNLNKLNDNMSSLLATLMSHLGSANGIAPLNASGVVDINKGGTNASTVDEARTNLGINNVVNTGDSATPVSGGTDKFTTGGAYAELAKKADLLDLASAFSTSTNYSIGSYVTYNGNLYRFKQTHSAGAWSASEVTVVTVGGQLNDTFLSYHRKLVHHSGSVLTNKYILIFERTLPVNNYQSPVQLYGTIGKVSTTDKALINAEIDFRNAGYLISIKGDISTDVSSSADIIATFETSTNTARVYIALKASFVYADIYSDYALLDTAVSQGVAEPVGNITASLTEVLIRNGKANMSDLATAFSASTSYAVGDYVTYNGNMYRCTVAHSAGAWDSSRFTAVTVGGDLALKADKTTTVNGHALSGNVTVTKSDVGLGSVENTGDSATPVSGGLTKFTTGGAYTELAKKVDKTTKVNGHALNGNVTVTKGDVGLGSVENTGDSATPVSGGLTKFTTGGAYKFFGGNTNANAWLGKVFGWALGKNWTQGTGSMTSDRFNSVYYANGIWVAGSFGHGLWWSTDGKAWTQGTGSMTSDIILSIYYANGIWVAGSYAHGLWWSTDGKTWTQGTTGSMTSYDFYSVYYANGIWVAGSGCHGLWWSTDGKAWTQGTGSMTSYSFNSVYYANGIWVAGSYAHGLWWSTDGKAWTQGTGSMTSYDFYSVYYANGIWVAGSGSHGLWWSTNGKAWTQGTGSMTSDIILSIYYANGIWVAGSRVHGLWWSTDGKAWTQVTGLMIDYTFHSIYYANNIWVAGSEEGGLYWSTDGKTWTQVTGSTTDYEFRTIYYANGIWVAGSASHGLWYSDFTNADIK